jgi:hypothetical protein
MVVDLQQAREDADIAAARAEYLRTGGTPEGWQDLMAQLEDAAAAFFVEDGHS